MDDDGDDDYDDVLVRIIASNGLGPRHLHNSNPDILFFLPDTS